MKPRPPADNVVSLSHYRAQLGRGRRERRSETLFAGPDPAATIAALPADEFFYVLSETGFPEALEVLAHATPEQVQGALDFALWDRDRIAGPRADEWLMALAASPYEAVGRWVRGLDIELVALLLRQRARIYDLSEGEPPDEAEGTFFHTPDRLFAIDLLGSEDQQRTTMGLLDSIYRTDAGFARRLLVGARADDDAELEEFALRWRAGRMADLGFVDFYEALEVYREIDPASIRLDEAAPATRARPIVDGDSPTHLRLPMVLAERLSGSSPFARAAAGITRPEELAELHAALVALANRVLSADRIAPGDADSATPVLARMAATLDLAIEFLARGESRDQAGDGGDRATRAVRTVPLLRLFQLGVSLTGKVARLGWSLRRETPFARARPPIDIFEAEAAEVVDATTRLRPLFPRRLESPPAAGLRPFASLGDIAAATAALERAGAALALVLGLGVRPDDLAPEALAGSNAAGDPEMLDAGIVARTVLVARLGGKPRAGFAPLAPAIVAAFNKKFGKAAPRSAATKADLTARATRILTAAVPGGRLSPATNDVARAWITSLWPLEPVLTTAVRRRPARGTASGSARGVARPARPGRPRRRKR